MSKTLETLHRTRHIQGPRGFPPYGPAGSMCTPHKFDVTTDVVRSRNAETSALPAPAFKRDERSLPVSSDLENRARAMPAMANPHSAEVELPFDLRITNPDQTLEAISAFDLEPARSAVSLGPDRLATSDVDQQRNESDCEIATPQDHQELLAETGDSATEQFRPHFDADFEMPAVNSADNLSADDSAPSCTAERDEPEQVGFTHYDDRLVMSHAAENSACGPQPDGSSKAGVDELGPLLFDDDSVTTSGVIANSDAGESTWDARPLENRFDAAADHVEPSATETLTEPRATESQIELSAVAPRDEFTAEPETSHDSKRALQYTRRLSLNSLRAGKTADKFRSVPAVVTTDTGNESWAANVLGVCGGLLLLTALVCLASDVGLCL